ncbi:unnamed protein product [Moneuplotes crassus]|uniref:Uncharacterized protein n=1 Tax=Euplotes crassus TaxID=5936 RepID=A0AAD1UIL3_EUPCR|nr:unnamed protein product [Moneuplotes crassus]
MLHKDQEWFAFETKLHDYITSRLGPVLTLIKQTDEFARYQETKIAALERKNEEIDENMYQLEKKQRFFTDFKDSLFTLKQQVRSHYIVSQEESAKVRSDIENFKQNIKEFSSTTNDVDIMTKVIKNELEKVQETVMEHKTYYNKEIAVAKTYITDYATDLQSEFDKLKLKNSYDSTIMENKKKEIDRMIVDIEVIKQKMQEDETNLVDLINFKNVFEKSFNASGPAAIEKLVQLSAEILKKDTSHDIKILSNHIEEVEQELRKTDNYIEKQLPLQYTTAFGELLDYTIASRNVREKLMEYMDYKITEYNENIDKDTGWPTSSKELTKEKVTGFKYSELTFPELLKQLKLKSKRSKKSPKVSPKLKSRTKFIPRIGLERMVRKSPQSNWDSQEGSENNDDKYPSSKKIANVELKEAKSDMQPEDFGDDFNYMPSIEPQIKDEEMQLDKVLSSVSTSYQQVTSKAEQKETSQYKNESENLNQIQQQMESKEVQFKEHQDYIKEESKSSNREIALDNESVQESESSNNISRVKTLPAPLNKLAKKVTFNEDDQRSGSSNKNFTISQLVKDYSLQNNKRKLLKENTITELDQNHLTPNLKIKIHRQSSDKPARIEEEEKIDGNKSANSRNSSPQCREKQNINPFVNEEISSSSQDPSNKSASNQSPSSSMRSMNLKLIQCERDSVKEKEETKVPLIKIFPMKPKRQSKKPVIQGIIQKGKSLGSIDALSKEIALKKEEEVPSPSQNTLRSDLKTLEPEFEVIKESAEQKEDSHTDIEESKSNSFGPSYNIEESSESDDSDEEAASILEQSTVSRATMKRLNLVRRPTIEESSLQSPKKLHTMTDMYNNNLKQELIVENKKRDEEIKKQYEDFVSLKTNELSIDIKSASKKFTDYQETTEKLVKQNTEDLLVHLKEETKRRIRDRNDFEIKFEKISKQISEINQNSLGTKDNITSVADLLKNLINLLQINDMLGLKVEDLDNQKNCKQFNSVVLSPFKRICIGHEGDKLTINGQQTDHKALKSRKGQILDDIDILFNRKLKSLCSEDPHTNLNSLKIQAKTNKSFCSDTKFIAVPGTLGIPTLDKTPNILRIKNRKNLASATIGMNTMKMRRTDLQNSSLDCIEPKILYSKWNPQKSSYANFSQGSGIHNRSASSEGTFRTLSEAKKRAY